MVNTTTIVMGMILNYFLCASFKLIILLYYNTNDIL